MRIGHFELNTLNYVTNESASKQAHERQCLPLANAEVTWWTATQVAALGIGTAIVAGGLRRATFVDVLASSTELFVLEAGGAHALVAAQGVVTGSSPADVGTEAFIFICRENQKKTRHIGYGPEVSIEGAGSGHSLLASWPSARLSGK